LTTERDDVNWHLKQHSMKKLILFVLISFLSHALYSQANYSIQKSLFEKNLCLLTGVNYNKHTFVDIGISVNTSGVAGHHPIATAYFFAGEFHFVKKPIAGFKAGAWAAGGVAPLAIGLNIIYYSDFDQGSLMFRPEIGLGFDRVKITYGYNARLTNSSFDRISKNTFGLTYCFKLKKLHLRSFAK
jgi:hypothetical protein